MAKKQSLLEKMRRNANNDWRIEDVLKLAKQTGLDAAPPHGGSHYTLASSYLSEILTVPFKRPIKRCYIKQLVRMVDAHHSAEKAKEQGNEV